MHHTTDTCPLAVFNRHSLRIIEKIKESGRPQTLMIDSNPSVVVVDADTWEEKQNLLERAETLAGIRKGFSDIRAGKGVDAVAFFDELAQMERSGHYP